MAEDNHWALDALRGILPEETYQVLKDNVLNPQTPFQIFRRQLVYGGEQAFRVIRPYAQMLVDRVIEFLQESPDIVAFAIVLGFLALALQIVLYIHRVMMFWTRLAMRTIMWALVAVVIAIVWQRGPETAFHDVLMFTGKLAGYLSLVKDIWLSEYRKYDAQTKNSGKMGSGRSRRSGR